MATELLIYFLFKSKFMRKFILLLTFTLSYVTCAVVYNYSVECDANGGPFECQHGNCLHNKCECHSGWTGTYCQFCSGRLRLWNDTGVITDGSGNYSENNQCTWLIDPSRPNTLLRLYLNHFVTECSWDHLYIYNGGSIYDPLLAVFSGVVVEDDGVVSNVPEVVATSGKALLYFYSDAALNLTGFSIAYKVNGCPKYMGKECSGRGVCLEGVCTCDAGWSAADCSQPLCPVGCSRHGSCDVEARRCNCHHGYSGYDCSQRIELGWWESIPGRESDSDSFSSELLRRSSHASSVVSGVVWSTAGYSFTTMDFLVQLNLTDGIVRGVEAKGRMKPTPRYGHTSVVYKGAIYIYGGSLIGKFESSELWSFNPSKRSWTKHRHSASARRGRRRHRRAHADRAVPDQRRKVRSKSSNIPVLDPSWSVVEKKKKEKSPTANSGRRKADDESKRRKDFHGSCLVPPSSESCLPVAVVGHASVVVDHRMLVIFGYSSSYGAINLVQEYHFKSHQWKMIESNGAVVSGTYGHTAVWDPVSGFVYVHGGLESLLSNRVLDRLLAYEPFQRKWFIKRASPLPRFLHSASISSGLILVFGGNTHNDSSHVGGSQCYAADLVAYDIHCDTWRDLHPLPELGVRVGRFGHTSVVFRDSLIVQGGFNGLMLGNSLRYHLGKCEGFSSRENCLSSFPGRKCVWNRVLDRCEAFDEQDRSAYDVCSERGGSSSRSNDSVLCSEQSSCQSCLYNAYDCVWCGNGCSYKFCSDYSKGVSAPENCEDRSRWLCRSLKTCDLCLLHKEYCIWVEKECTSVPNHTVVAKLPSNVLSPRLSDLTEPKQQVSAASNATSSPAVSKSTCPVPCNQRTTCINCTQGSCIWCRNQQRCVDNKSYLVSFPYGQCREWTTTEHTCPFLGNNSSRCVVHQTCKDCHEDIACGWCDDGTKTGTGVCMEGGQLGPVEPATGELQLNKCPQYQWFFTTCPVCNCNGHSHCVNDSVCVQPCANNTEGRQCQRCRASFYGRPINGGLCKPCHCNSHGTTCETDSGVCHCHTKGVTGDNCERCDTQNNYYGEPLKGSCFYDLQIDYQFTFNLSKQEDSHIRQINFYNVPSKPSVDTDFDIQCSKPVSIKISARPTGGHEEWIVRNFTGVSVKRRFLADEYAFGAADNNTTFHVYVFNFTPPIEIVISFSQHPKLDLIQFFSIFSLCFMVLLLLSFVLWKIKQRYDAYSRRQRFMVELEAMASRPFCSIYLELQKPHSGTSVVRGELRGHGVGSALENCSKGASNGCSTAETSLGSREGLNSTGIILSEKGLEAASQTHARNASEPEKKRKRKKRSQQTRSCSREPVLNRSNANTYCTNGSSTNGVVRPRTSFCNGTGNPLHASIALQTPTDASHLKTEISPSPIALEPCSGNKAAVLSLLIELPTGGGTYTSPGHPGGLAVASTLVSLGPPPLPSSESSFFSRESSKAPAKKIAIVTVRDVPPC